ncbi:MAG: DUF1501 domain-containing protein [Verrucomicrobia bacterium]|nr:DUF1501 domain-containing protein [Verrucomicrobiota bacterium]
MNTPFIFPPRASARVHSRREMLRRASMGFGSVALAGLFAEKSSGAVSAATSTAMRRPHFTPRAKHVIFCYMSGGVSHVDSFDPKPELVKRHGQPMPVPVKPTMFNNNGNIMASPWAAKPRGQSGIVMTDLFPHIAARADDLAVIRSMTSKVNEHAQGNYFFHTGFSFSGHPSAGAWMSYGLGTENENLPGFVVLNAGDSTVPHGGVGLFSNGYLPAQHQASLIRVDSDPALANIKPGESDALQRQRLGFIRAMDEGFAASTHEAAVEGAILNYETAYRMQSAVPELCDLRGESDATKKLYGLDSPHAPTVAYGKQALVARRLIERGVRFVELSCLPQEIGEGQGPNPWDQHGALQKGHTKMARQVDQPIAGLITDLKARGLLDETLIIFSGEFGRTPFSQGSDGRDHNPFGFSLWLAGGGVKGGTVFGATDDLGYHAVENKCDIYDFWATVQHLLGIEHTKLTYRFGGRDFRLTDVHGNVIREILA